MDILIWLLSTWGDAVIPGGWTLLMTTLSAGESLGGSWWLLPLLGLGVIYMTLERDGLMQNDMARRLKKKRGMR